MINDISEYEIPILESHLKPWTEYECMCVHYWKFLESGEYDCPICLWHPMPIEASWLGGKPVGGA